MNFTVIFCCYVLAPYFASIVSPPQEAITCNAIPGFFFGCHHKKEKKPEEKRPEEKRPGEKRPEEKKPEENRLEEKIESHQYDRYLPILLDNYFPQKVDHYNFTDARKWEQLYLIKDRHYNGNGLIFLRIGTAEEITRTGMQTGSWYQYCAENRALCVGIVQRGYGETFPNGNLKEENLKYLTTEQALADMAWFIYSFRDHNKDLQSVLPKKLKWVTYGVGRQGALAIFMRLKFPHLVHSTLAISAPVLAKEDFNDFFTLIESDMLDKELELKNTIKKAYTEIINQVNNRKYESIGKLFKFCNEKLLEDNIIYKEKNMDFMYFTLAQTVALVMRYGNDDLLDIKNQVTDIMLGKNEEYKKSSPKERFAALIKIVSRTEGCIPFDYYKAGKEYIEKIESGITSLDYPLPGTFGERADFYQSCNEFGRFVTFDDFFGTTIGLEFYTEFCQAVFGDRFKNHLGTRLGVRRTNVFYGGLDIVVSNVIYVYADKDPLRKLGIINTRSGPTETHFVDGRHCEELFNLKKNKSSSMNQIFDKLTEWLDSPENNEKNSNVNPRAIPNETGNPKISETPEETTNEGNNVNKTDGNL